jgi:hypothetical protein
MNPAYHIKMNPALWDFWTCGAGCARPRKPNVDFRSGILEASHKKSGEQLSAMDQQPQCAQDEGIEAAYEVESHKSLHLPLQLNDPYPFNRN